MDYKWKFFKEISYVTFILVASFLVTEDFFSDMLVTGLAVLVSTCRYMGKPPAGCCDRKIILVAAEASMYAGYEFIACKRYISAPPLELSLKALTITAPMIVTAYQHYRSQNPAAINSPVSLEEEVGNLENPTRNNIEPSI